MFYLRSERRVLGEPAVIAAEFPVTVRDLLVREGERVKAGSVAAVVSSQTVAESIARLTADLAARESRLSEMRIRGEKVAALIKLAETRQEVTAGARAEMEKLLKGGCKASGPPQIKSRSQKKGFRADGPAALGGAELR